MASLAIPRILSYNVYRLHGTQGGNQLGNNTHSADSTYSKRGIPLRLAAMFMAVLLLFAMLGGTAQASTGRYTGVVSSAVITSDNYFTYLTFTANERLTFTFGYTRTTVSIRVNRASYFPDTVSVGANPLFTSARWLGNTLTLTLTSRDGFVGYHGFYDADGNMVIRFRNPPSSMSVARIVIDPGHGGRDRGAEGFRRDLPESVLNQQISSLLAAELRQRGATVLVLDTAQGMELRERVRQAELFNADFFISIHKNASRSASARGTEVFFFTPFSHIMAATASRNISGRLGTTNRGAKRARFAVTMSPQFISVLVESGFMTNRAEYEKLINPHYQREIALGLANAVDAVIAHSYPGSGRVS